MSLCFSRISMIGCLVCSLLLSRVSLALEEVPPEPAEVPPELAGVPHEEKQPHGFGRVTLSPQVGYSFFPESNYDYDGFTLSVDQRNSFTAKLHLDFGGDGFAFELAPLFSMEALGSDPASFGSDLSAGASGKFFAVGGQIGLVYRASWKSFYPHLGLGFHGTYLMGDSIRYGTEIYGRIPAGFTVYVAKRFAFVVEVAFLYGATGIRFPDPDTSELAARLQADYGVDINSIDWQNTSPEELQLQYGLTNEQMTDLINEEMGKSIKFGNGPGFEAVFGVRFF
jgi:hypothetical protein